MWTRLGSCVVLFCFFRTFGIRYVYSISVYAEAGQFISLLFEETDYKKYWLICRMVMFLQIQHSCFFKSKIRPFILLVWIVIPPKGNKSYKQENRPTPSEWLLTGQITHYKHALLHLLVHFTGSFQSNSIFQQCFRWYQAVKEYLLSQHYVSVLATAEAITLT